jgi:hypothetical protein
MATRTHKNRIVQAGVADAGDNPVDFWLQRSGSINKIGQPKRTYGEYDIGITVLDKSVFLPDYLYHWFLNIYNQRYWESFSYGSLQLKHIRLEDVRQLLDKLTEGS